MRIAVCIPSYNEADSIGHVVVEVDRALTSLFETGKCTIVNTDSGSTDDTRRVFLETPTRCRKLLFDLSEEPRGKGRNLFHFFTWAMENDVDYLVSVDADVSSMTGSWVEKLSSPLVRGEADFVAPLYRRDRFEAISTNHFAYPLVYGYLGVDLRQPIGGEFGFTRRTAECILSRPVDEPAINRYGIDIFMSMHAVGAGFRVAQVSLGRKIHKNTFPKMSEIFRDVAAGGVAVARQLRFSPTVVDQGEPYAVEDDDAFPYGASSQEMFSKARRSALELLPIYMEWWGRQDTELEESIRSEHPSLTTRRWASLFAGCIAGAVSDRTLSAGDVAEQLLPAFLMRAVTFWTEIEGVAASAVAEALLAQARMFREELAQRM